MCFCFAPSNDLVIDNIHINPFIFTLGMHKGWGHILISEMPRNKEELYPFFLVEDYEYGELMDQKFPLNKHVDDGEIPVSLVYVKLATSLFCYMRAFPECVVPGIPSDMSIKEMMHGGPKNRRTGFTIKAPIDAATGRALHLRRGHFRSLHDERFKRNDDGSIKIVWVRESVVGGKIDPYTVEAHAV